MAKDHSPPTEAPELVETVPLAEEHARIEKRQIMTGKVRVRTNVEVVEEVVRGSLDEEVVEVTRVPIDRYVDEAPALRTEEGVTIVPVIEEVLVVEKRLLLKEELHIHKSIRTEEVSVPVQLRREKATVERTDAEDKQ